MIDLPKFKIGNLEIILIQGGMGVGISGYNLASAVANCGGAGIIASVGLGLLKKSSEELIGIHAFTDYAHFVEANQEALREEIRKARQKSNGVIGVNIMHALSDYQHLVKAAVEENIDLIICGAGIPRDLPALVGDKPISLVPIVSDRRIAKAITKAWSRYNKIPDAFIVEGPMAGGHLGFDYDNLVNNSAPSLEDLAKDIIDFTKDNFDNPPPVIVAGGIYTGQDIRKAHEYGAAGVQTATRFVTTLECDTNIRFKQAYLKAKKEDIKIIKSPVGMPGRAIRSPFLDEVLSGKEIEFDCNYQCLKPCKPKESPYCIAEALIYAQLGNLNKGFAFSGANGYRATPETCLDADGNFITVKTLMQRISDEYNSS